MLRIYQGSSSDRVCKGCACIFLLVFCAESAAQQVSPWPESAPTAQVASQQPANDVAKQGETTFTWRDHPTLQIGDHLELDFRARIQADVRQSGFVTTNRDLDGVDIARRRIGVAGTIDRIATFEVERELDDNRPWRDVYLNYEQFPVAEVKGGRFKLPFSLDENTSATNLDFIYRSRAATQLAPGRDEGVMAHGRRGPVRYEFGIFAGDGDNSRADPETHVTGATTPAGRVVVDPFRESKSVWHDLQVGVAFTTSTVPEGPGDIRGRTPLGESFFPPAILVNGTRRRIGFEQRWRPGPFSLKAEYIRLTNERLGQRRDDGDLPPLESAGWYVSGTWILTGEQKSRGADNPKRPLFQGGYGAIEVGGRIEKLSFWSDGAGQVSTSPRADVIPHQSDRAATLGVNWFPNRWTKLQFNVIQEQLVLPSRDATVQTLHFWSRVLRVQFAL
jgi:phosphate-selective porin OprO/OprP